MAQNNNSDNRVREFRTALNLTQSELAQLAGISRTAVTAIEGAHLAPSVFTALALARALNTTAEALFAEDDPSGSTPEWGWTPQSESQPYWQAEVGGRLWMYPADATPMLTPPPDGMRSVDDAASTTSNYLPLASAEKTLVLACCDPAAGLMADEYNRTTKHRMLILQRSSQQSLNLLREGKIHAAGLHLSTSEDPDRNAQAVRETLGTEYQLLRIAIWQEGIAMASTSRCRSIGSVVKSRFKWVGREPGSGARRCLDRLLGKRADNLRLVRHHRAVAEAVSSGWVDAGVCIQLASAEAGLKFLPVSEDFYDLCIPVAVLHDDRIQALINVVRSTTYRRVLENLPGYSTVRTGELNPVT